VVPIRERLQFVTAKQERRPAKRPRFAIWRCGTGAPGRRSWRIRLHPALFAEDWPEYSTETAELGLYMFAACAFATLLQHPDDGQWQFQRDIHCHVRMMAITVAPIASHVNAARIAGLNMKLE
jgi:hypothetical protein